MGSMLFILTGLGVGGFLLGFALTSFGEGERRAGRLALALALVWALLWTGCGWAFAGRLGHVAALFWLLAGSGTALLIMPWGSPAGLQIFPEKTERFDERHVIFGRMGLGPGDAQYQTYYGALNPGMRRFDDHLRSMPPLGEAGGQYAHELDSRYFQAIFRFIEGFHHLADPGAPRRPPIPLAPAEATLRLKGLARHLGALDARVTRLRDYHLYSHRGRHKANWGTPIDTGHTHALVIAVEMSHRMVHSAPLATESTEAAIQYLHGAKIAIAAATFISEIGYSARAHVDGNYQGLMTAMAHDAGIGELGRLGLIITPTHGPRVRLAAVTTDLPLSEDRPVQFGVQDFCRFCKKCAHNCPSGSIAGDEQRMVRGVLKWQSNMESCFQQWLKFGTDCGICLAVCPYSKPATFFHKLVRYAAARNHLARRVALWMDDLFYARRPRHTETPPWFGRYA